MSTNYYIDLLSREHAIQQQIDRLPDSAWMSKTSLNAYLKKIKFQISEFRKNITDIFPKNDNFSSHSKSYRFVIKLQNLHNQKLDNNVIIEDRINKIKYDSRVFTKIQSENHNYLTHDKQFIIN